MHSYRRERFGSHLFNILVYKLQFVKQFPESNFQARIDFYKMLPWLYFRKFFAFHPKSELWNIPANIHLNVYGMSFPSKNNAVQLDSTYIQEHICSTW